MDHPSTYPQNPYASPALSIKDEEPSVSPNKPNEPLVQPIHIFGELSKEDFNEAFKLGVRHIVPWFNRFVLYASIIAWIICVCAILQDIFKVWLLTMVTGGIFFFAQRVLYWKINRQKRESIEARKGPFQYDDVLISEEGFESRTRFTCSKQLWETFNKYRVTDRIAVLHYDGNAPLFHVFPRSKFQTPEDWTCFLGLLERKLPRC